MKNETRDVKQIRDAIEKLQSPKRFSHTLGVAETARRLAAVYGADEDKAYLAGLLHDCAKHLSGEQLLSFCERRGIDVTEAERKTPSLLHAKAGAYLAREEYGVTEPEILDAVRYHTTGRPGMGLLEQIVFVADYVEPGRRKAPELARVRELAPVSLKRAIVCILEDTLRHLHDTGAAIDPASRETLLYYKEKETAKTDGKGKSTGNDEACGQGAGG